MYGFWVFFFLPLRKRKKKIELHAVRSSKRGIWFPEIKIKQEERAPLEAEPSCTW
jgi:hypothetical protein